MLNPSRTKVGKCATLDRFISKASAKLDTRHSGYLSSKCRSAPDFSTSAKFRVSWRRVPITHLARKRGRNHLITTYASHTRPNTDAPAHTSPSPPKSANHRVFGPRPPHRLGYEKARAFFVSRPLIRRGAGSGHALTRSQTPSPIPFIYTCRSSSLTSIRCSPPFTPLRTLLGHQCFRSSRFSQLPSVLAILQHIVSCK